MKGLIDTFAVFVRLEGELLFMESVIFRDRANGRKGFIY